MADLDDLSPEEVPSVPDEPPTDQPLGNPDAVAQEDQDHPMPSGLDEGEDLSRDDPGTAV
jgi:hypothetical protein